MLGFMRRSQQWNNLDSAGWDEAYVFTLC